MREAERARERKRERRQQKEREEERDAEREREREGRMERQVLIERVRQLESDCEGMREKEKAREQANTEDHRREREKAERRREHERAREPERESQRQRAGDELREDDADKLLSGIEELLHTATRLTATLQDKSSELASLSLSAAAAEAGLRAVATWNTTAGLVATEIDYGLSPTPDTESTRKQLKLGVRQAAAQAQPPSPRGFLLPLAQVDEHCPPAQIAGALDKGQELHADTHADLFAQLQQGRADSHSTPLKPFPQWSPRRVVEAGTTGEGLSREEEWFKMWAGLKSEHRMEHRRLMDSFEELRLLKQEGDAKAAILKARTRELEARLLQVELRELEHQDMLATSGRLIDQALADLQVVQAHLAWTESISNQAAERIKIEAAAQQQQHALEVEKKRDMELALADARKALDAQTEDAVGLAAEMAEMHQQVMQLKVDTAKQFETGEAEMKEMAQIYDARIGRMVEQERELSNSIDYLTREREKQDVTLRNSDRERQELKQLLEAFEEARDKLELDLKQSMSALETQTDRYEELKIQVESERRIVAESLFTLKGLVSDSDTDVKALIHFSYGVRAYCEAQSKSLVQAQAEVLSEKERERNEGARRRESLHETINGMRSRIADLEDQNLILCNTKRHMEAEVRSRCHNLASEWDLLAFEVQVL